MKKEMYEEIRKHIPMRDIRLIPMKKKNTKS